MKRNKLVFIIVIQILVCLIFFEFISNFFLKNSKNALYRTRLVLQQDQSLGWKLRPLLNTSFEKTSLVSDSMGFRIASKDETLTDKNSVITLGPSSAFGWGVESEETYTHLFGNQFSGHTFNTSQIGYSSHQGLILWESFKESFAAKPFAYALIAYGINDLDKFRFYKTDYRKDQDFFSNLMPDSSKFWSDSFNFLNVLSITRDEVSLKMDCSPLARIEQRVDLESYVSNISNLIKSLKKQSTIPILINTPYYIKSINRDYTRERIEQKYGAVIKAASEKKCDEALRLLAEAKSLEPYRVAEDVIKLNQALKELADAEQVTLIDAYSLLNRGAVSEHYVDPVHPSTEGHKLIASQIKALVLN